MQGIRNTITDPAVGPQTTHGTKTRGTNKWTGEPVSRPGARAGEVVEPVSIHLRLEDAQALVDLLDQVEDKSPREAQVAAFITYRTAWAAALRS